MTSVYSPAFFVAMTHTHRYYMCAQFKHYYTKINMARLNA